jgi:hypothetical protein
MRISAGNGIIAAIGVTGLLAGSLLATLQTPGAQGAEQRAEPP